MKLSFILGCQDEKRTESFKDNLCMKTKNLKKKRKLVSLSINSRKDLNKPGNIERFSASSCSTFMEEVEHRKSLISYIKIMCKNDFSADSSLVSCFTSI